MISSVDWSICLAESRLQHGLRCTFDIAEHLESISIIAYVYNPAAVTAAVRRKAADFQRQSDAARNATANPSPHRFNTPP